jgi:hypothetical protein
MDLYVPQAENVGLINQIVIISNPKLAETD